MKNLGDSELTICELSRKETELVNGSKPNVWWVNQGKTFPSQFGKGYIWAPRKTRNEGLIYHWENVAKVVEGDIILSYFKRAIQGICKALGNAEIVENPYTQEYGHKEGHMVSLECERLDPPIGILKFKTSPSVLAIRQGPLSQSGKVKQGYLFPLSWEALKAIQKSQPETEWPDFVKLHQEL